MKKLKVLLFSKNTVYITLFYLLVVLAILHVVHLLYCGSVVSNVKQEHLAILEENHNFKLKMHRVSNKILLLREEATSKLNRLESLKKERLLDSTTTKMEIEKIKVDFNVSYNSLKEEVIHLLLLHDSLYQKNINFLHRIN